MRGVQCARCGVEKFGVGSVERRGSAQWGAGHQRAQHAVGRSMHQPEPLFKAHVTSRLMRAWWSMHAHATACTQQQNGLSHMRAVTTLGLTGSEGRFPPSLYMVSTHA